MKTKSKSMTQAKLAAILGISRQLIASHQRTGKAPPLSDVDGWQAYLAVNGRQGSAPPEERKQIARARVRLVRAQADRVEMENRARRSETFSAVAVQAFLNEIVGNFFFGELDRIAQEWPPSLTGKSAVAISKEVVAQIEQIKKLLRAKLDSIETNGTKDGDKKEKAQ